MEHIDSWIGGELTHLDVEARLTGAGWRRFAAGDWAIALMSPDGGRVARVSPFDPVGAFAAEFYRRAAPTSQVPRLFAHRRLAGGGDLQVLELLESVREVIAIEFHDRIRARDETVRELVRVLDEVHNAASRELPWFGPLDTNTSNVMRRPGGGLVLIDPFFADGPNLYAAASADPDSFVKTIPERERRYMTEIPLTSSGPWSEESRAALREAIAVADA